MIIGSLSTLGQESSGPISPLGVRVGARVVELWFRYGSQHLRLPGLERKSKENYSLCFSLGYSLFLSEFSTSKIRPTLGFFLSGIFGFSLKKNVSHFDEWSWLFIGKGWPAINQGRKTEGTFRETKGFWENEKLCEKRKVSAKDERFHEKRKVSRENREVSLLV